MDRCGLKKKKPQCITTLVLRAEVLVRDTREQTKPMSSYLGHETRLIRDNQICKMPRRIGLTFSTSGESKLPLQNRLFSRLSKAVKCRIIDTRAGTIYLIWFQEKYFCKIHCLLTMYNQIASLCYLHTFQNSRIKVILPTLIVVSTSNFY